MNDLSDNALLQIRTVVREEISPLKLDISDLKQDVSSLKQDVSTIKQDMKTVRLVLGNQSIMLGEVRADVRSLKNSSRSQSRDIHKLGVLFEDLDDRFQASSEVG